MILHANTRATLKLARKLLTQYVDELGIDPAFQHLPLQILRAELFALPGPYAPPAGRLMIAIADGKAAGCIALKRMTDDVCEMKRLYVKPSYRKRGFARELINCLIEEARKIGYIRMVLATTDSMKPAIKVYQSLGFELIQPYRADRIAGYIFMGATLKR